MVNIYTKEISKDLISFLNYVEKTELKDLFKLIYKVNLSKNNVDLDNIKNANFIYITDTTFDEVDEDTFFDFCIEVISEKKRVYIKNIEDFKNNEIIQETVNDLDFNECIINYDFNIDLSNPNINMYTTLLEIFNIKDFKNNEKVVALEILNLQTKEDKILFKDETISLAEHERLLQKILQSLKVKHLKRIEQVFTSFLMNEDLFLFVNMNKEEYIEEFKKEVFNTIKDLSIDEYMNLAPSIRKMFTEQEYIPLSEIKTLLKN